MWQTAKTTGATTWNGIYKVADKVGFWTNKQMGKFGVEAFYPTDLETEVIKAARILRTFTLDAPTEGDAFEDRKKKQKVIRKIPPKAIDECAGLAIFTVFRTGLGISGAGGSGIVIARLPDGSWSAPSGILLHTLGWGFLAGVDVYDVVLILRTPGALNSFTSPRVTIGGEASVTAGPVGNGVMLEAGKELSPVWSYTKSKGLYGGLQVDGNIVLARPDENARSYYRPGVKVKEILAGEIHPPAWCAPLHQTILAASGHQTATDQIPSGPSASEMYSPPRRLDPEEEDYNDQVARAEMEEALRQFGIDDPQINQRRQSQDEYMIHEPSPTSSAPMTPPATAPDTPPTIKGAPATPQRPPRRFVAPPPARHVSEKSGRALSIGSRSEYGDASTSERALSPKIPEAAEEEELVDPNAPQIPEPPVYTEHETTGLPATEPSDGQLSSKSGEFGIAQ